MGAQRPYLPGTPPPPRLGRRDGGVGGWEVSLRVSRERSRGPGAALTLAPLCSSASATALPMPCAAPVTSATLPFTCMVRPLLGVSAPPQLLCSRARACTPARRPPASGRGGNCQASARAPRAVSPCPERSQEPSRAIFAFLTLR